MKKYMFTAAVGAASIFYAQEKCADIRINQIQVLGTHNSYAKPVDPKVLDLTVPIIKSLMEKYNSGMSSEQKAKFQEYHPNGMDFHEALKYDHPDFVQQLNANLRGLELDVYYDPDGNRF